jgi:hypothetical protein
MSELIAWQTMNRHCRISILKTKIKFKMNLYEYGQSHFLTVLGSFSENNISKYDPDDTIMWNHLVEWL